MNLPPLNALRAFEATARLLNFSRAGDELHITHSAVSHQVKRLEQWLGRPVFERKANGIELTSAGAALSQFLTPSFIAMAELSARLKLQAETRTITVGCIPSIASRWLVPRLAEFSKAQPDLEISVQYATPQQRLSLGELDVLVTLGMDPSPTAENIKIFSRVNKPVCSPHYLARIGAVNSPAGIAGAQLLHDETRSAWEEWFRAAGVRGPKTLQGPVFQDFNLLATAVIAGHGIALCPTEVFREELKRGDLVIVSDVETQADKGYYIITKAQASKAVLEFRDWFIGITRSDTALATQPAAL